MTRPTFLSLFSGIGGLDLGLERAGWECVGQVEIDPFCRRVLAKHWPEVPRWGDIKELDPDELPRADLVCGGFPCQPVSLAGQRRGQDDERWLWPELHRIVRGLRPRWVLLENVPGLLVRGMGDVLGDLAASGYDAEWDCIPAFAVGAPHRRDRAWIVAYPISTPLQGHTRGVDSQAGARTSQGPQRQRLRPHVVDGGAGAGVTSSEALEIPPGQGRQPPRAFRPWTEAGAGPFGEPPRSSWWATEPDVGRVASRIPSGLDGGLDAHPGCLTQARTASLPSTERMRALRRHLATSAASSEPARCGICGHPLSAMPCRGACSPWYVGTRIEEAEDLRCLREGLLGLLAQSGEVLFTRVPDGTWQGERPQAVGQRVDRLRALGNAVVPQVAELIGRRILEAAA